MILADPRFSMNLAPQFAAGLPDTEPRLRSVNQRFGAAFSNAQPLPGTPAEAAAIEGSLESWTGRKPEMFLQQNAVESVVKSAHSPQCLVLSTHGFFFGAHADATGPTSTNATSTDTTSTDTTSTDTPSTDTPSTDTTSTDTNSEAAQQTVPGNPLLWCGLLLAGCHHADNVPAGSDDGILTGMEIISSDLRGTDLVVLSACESGLGDVRSGEGIAGLRQAFQLAGAASVVATLWQVDDTATARLMDGFFSNLARGMDKSEALRRAQLERIQARRERHGAAHPFFWAAFTLTGQDQSR